MPHSFSPTSRFLDPEKSLFQAGLSAGAVVADLGAGSGFYAVASGKIVGDQGVVYVCDILESSLDHVAAEARAQGIKNIRTFRCDLEQANSCQTIPDGSVDMVVLANLTHQIQNREVLVAECYRLLKTGGKVMVIEWNDSPSPIGPISSQRLDESKIQKLFGQTFKSAGAIDTDPYHYGLLFIK